MSDSEYESVVGVLDSEAEGASRRVKAKSSARKSITQAQSKSDSEDDHPSRRDKAQPSKRKSTARAPSKTGRAKKRNTKKDEDLFGLVSDEEEDAAHANALRRAPTSHLPSSISSKVADGSVLRRAQLSGRYYVELRLYATRDALATRPDTRYTKALVTLKLQLDPDQLEWEVLQKFLKKTKTKYFANSEPVFYNNNCK